MHHVSRAGGVLNLNSFLPVPGNNVAFPGGQASDGIASRRSENDHSMPAIAQADQTCHIRANVIAMDKVARRICRVDGDTVVIVPGNDVPRLSGRPPDGVAGRIVKKHATGVAQVGSPGHIRADVVALHDISCRPGLDKDTD